MKVPLRWLDGAVLRYIAAWIHGEPLVRNQPARLGDRLVLILQQEMERQHAEQAAREKTAIDSLTLIILDTMGPEEIGRVQ